MTTVISGRVAYGIGKKADLAAAKIYLAGSYYYTPPNVPHFLLAVDSDVVYQSRHGLAPCMFETAGKQGRLRACGRG